MLVEEAPAAVDWLLAKGVRFDTEGAGEEVSRSASRAVTRRAGSSTPAAARPAELTDRLSALVAAESLVEIRENTSALALWSDDSACAGVITDTGPIPAHATILATGGGAALWADDQPVGSDRRRAGAGARGRGRARRPRVLSIPSDRAGPAGEHDGTLVTEAVRGEGATLLGADGRRFADEARASRQVAAAILDRMRADRTDHVRIDLRGIDPARFPNVFAAIERAGLDPRRLSRFRWRPPRTTSWAGSLPTSRAAPPCPASTRSGSAPARGCTARIAWPRTR